jgi:SSS family solute:Na+ symporter
MITRYDCVIIAFYLIFILALGVIFRRLSKNTSDYFRCGGVMPWWITGASAWVAGFSAWAFVGAAGQAYREGLNVLVVFYSMLFALVLILIYTSVRFRRLRVVTWMEAVLARFGPFNEQFYTWIKVPLLIVLSGFGLNSIGVFITAVFRQPLEAASAVIHVPPIVIALIVLGTTITIVACAGGAFAVLASDFVQMCLVVTITLVTSFLVLRDPQVGGISGLVQQVRASHPAHFNIFAAGSPMILAAWALAFIWVKIYEQNNMEMATMYLMARSDKHARRMVIIPLIGTVIGPLIWLIPPLAATIVYPNLAHSSEYSPLLTQPTEAAFVAMAMKVMPVGLLGLLMSAMIGATLTSMDAAVNKGVGVFVRSFYRPIINPAASEKRMLIIGKLCTLCFGVLIIGVAVLVSIYRNADLFSLMNQVGVSLAAPLALPIFFGLFYKRTPAWSAWGTALACFVAVAWANFIVGGFIAGRDVSPILLPRFFREWLRSAIAFPSDGSQLLLVITTVSASVVGVVGFFGSTFFYDASSAEYKRNVEQFFLNLRTPVETPRQIEPLHDEVMYHLLGLLCITYGMFILALMLIPNPMGGRMCFLFCGGVIGSMGALLYWRARVRARRHLQPLTQTGGQTCALSSVL